MTRRFDKGFKIHVAKLVIEEGKVVVETARQLDISVKPLYKSVADYKKDIEHSFVGSGNLKPGDCEKSKLQKRIRELEKENVILKSHKHLRQKREVIFEFIPYASKGVACDEDVQSLGCFKKWILCLDQIYVEHHWGRSAHHLCPH